MRINYHETRKDLCEFFHDLVKRSLGYYAISQNGDFFKTAPHINAQLRRTNAYIPPR